MMLRLLLAGIKSFNTSQTNKHSIVTPAVIIFNIKSTNKLTYLNNRISYVILKLPLIPILQTHLP